MKNYPKIGTTYTLDYIINVLELRDSPNLSFLHQGRWTPIQGSHCTDEQFLSNPAFAATQWTYQYETDEWIPVFRLARGQSLEGLVVVEPSFDYWTGEVEPDEYFAFPTHCPRRQYFADGVTPQGYMASNSEEN